MEMLAPRPHFEAYVSRARLYVADAEAIIKDVDHLDISDLVFMGCRHRDPSIAPLAAPPPSVEAEQVQQEQAPKPAAAVKSESKLKPLPSKEE